MKYSTNFVTSLKKLTNSNLQSDSIKEERKDSGISLLDDCNEASKKKSKRIKNQTKQNKKRFSNFFNKWGKIKNENTFDSDRSPYFIQTWWDPVTPISFMEKEDQSPRSKPLFLVPYLPPIWVEEEMESISPDSTLVNDEEEEEAKEEFALTISLYEAEEEEQQKQQSMCQNYIPLQNSSFLTVPVQLSKCETINKIRKVRFEIGARLDPNEDCLLNCVHPIYGKRQHKHASKCQHVRFTLEIKEEEGQETKRIQFPKHKREYKLKSCLKVQTQTESLRIVTENKFAPKSILRTGNGKSKGKEEKVRKVTFDERADIHLVDRYMEWEQTVAKNQSLQCTIRANRLERRREFIRTKPFEDWIDDMEQDESFSSDVEDNDVKGYNTIKQSKTAEEDQSDKSFITCYPNRHFAEKHHDFLTKRNLLSFNEQNEFSHSIIHKIRFERQWLPLLFLNSEIELDEKDSQHSP